MKMIEWVVTEASKTRAQVLNESRGSRLSATSELFMSGDPDGSSTDTIFIRRLNTLMMRSRVKVEDDVPGSFALGISTAGKLDHRVELIAIGHWLLIDSAPGLNPRRGRQPDPRTLLKCVAAAILELDRSPKREKYGVKTADRDARRREVTKHQLARAWKILFREEKDSSFFDAKLRSMRAVVPAYLAHVQSGDASYDGRHYKSSPEIERVGKALAGRLPKTQKHERRRGAVATDVGPASPAPFEIVLRYSSDMEEARYRRQSHGQAPPTVLRYCSVEASRASTSAEDEADQRGRIQLAPDLLVRENFKTTAVVDRIILLLNTKTITDGKMLNKIGNDAGTNSAFGLDLTMKETNGSWGAPLPEVPLDKKTGHHFALLVQDPTPDSLTSLIEAINSKVKIDGSVRVHLLEVAIDFYPKKGLDTREALELREKMVGALQRHHWAKPSYFLEGSPEPVHYMDMRQLFDAGAGQRKGPKTRFVFSHTRPAATESDQSLKISSVRDRILTEKEGAFLYLNSTVAKGAQNAPYHVKIQHKIADQRNAAKKELTDLPDEKRRARMEVTISGQEELQKRGLSKVDDLASISFRRLAGPLIGCRIAEVGPVQNHYEDAVAQMERRGVYGVELRERAAAIEYRVQAKALGEKPQRLRIAPGKALASWGEMNAVVGKSLDQLTLRWRKFSL